MTSELLQKLELEKAKSEKKEKEKTPLSILPPPGINLPPPLIGYGIGVSKKVK